MAGEKNVIKLFVAHQKNEDVERVTLHSVAGGSPCDRLCHLGAGAGGGEQSFDPFGPWEGFVMKFSMGLACIFSMPTSVKRVSVCNMGMMSCLFMRSGLYDVLPLQDDGEPLRRGVLRQLDDVLLSF